MIYYILLSLMFIYLLILIVMIKLGWGKKLKCNNCINCCPNCYPEVKIPLTRINRNKYDKIFNHITLRLFKFKKYECNHCHWQGLR